MVEITFNNTVRAYKVYQQLIVLIISILFTDFVSAGPPYIDKVPPLSKISGVGISIIVPDESDWLIFDPDGKGSTIVKFGKSKFESYIISVDYYKHPDTKSEYKFNDLYKILKERELTPPRFKVIKVSEKPNILKAKDFINFYYLVEDHQAKYNVSDENYMLLETIGFLAVNPNDHSSIVRVSYSYRYFKGNKDRKFKKKAKWVLDRAAFESI